jgi:hypothetical protein
MFVPDGILIFDGGQKIKSKNHMASFGEVWGIEWHQYFEVILYSWLTFIL